MLVVPMACSGVCPNPNPNPDPNFNPLAIADVGMGHENVVGVYALTLIDVYKTSWMSYPLLALLVFDITALIVAGGILDVLPLTTVLLRAYPLPTKCCMHPISSP